MNMRDGAGYQMFSLGIIGTALFAILIFIESNPQRFVYFISEKLKRRRILIGHIVGELFGICCRFCSPTLCRKVASLSCSCERSSAVF